MEKFKENFTHFLKILYKYGGVRKHTEIPEIEI